MKKNFVLLFLCLFQITFSFSQTTGKGSIALSVGPAFPLGKFTSKDFTDAKAGFARTGQAVSLSFTKMVSKTLGIVADVRGQRNPINTKAFEGSLAKAFVQHPNWKVDKRAWLNGVLLIGGIGQYALSGSHKLSLTTKGMIGVMYATSPGLNGNSVSATAAARIEQTKKSAIGFTYSFGGGINYDFTKRLFFVSLLTCSGTNTLIYKDFRTTTITSQGTPGSPDHAVQQSISSVDRKQTITSINLLMGIGIRI